MKTTRQHYTEQLTNNRLLNHRQEDNGMYYAEIKDQYNTIESAIITTTLANVWQWLRDRQ